MVKYLKGFLSALFAIVALVFVTSPALAIADPDSAPAVNAVYVYEFDDGSVGVLVDYYLEYAVVPDETVTEAYLVVFVDTDGTTQLESTTPYTFQNSGYDRGLAWIYFTADEADTYALASADVADYRVWLVGNPTVASGWTGDPPKTISTIDQWYTTGDIQVLLALRVLYYADLLELEWSLDLVETTSLGNKLATLGESYFENAIPNLRTLAPACFAASTSAPDIEDIDYTTQFGAVLTNGTGTAAGSPITLAEGNNNVNVTGLGTFTVELEQGTQGTATTDVATVAGSPAALVAGTNTITVGGVIGNIVVAVNLVDTTTGLEDSVTGTGWDLTAVGAIFGMSRWMFSGIIWLVCTVLICASAVGGLRKQHSFNADAGVTGKTILVLFNICMIVGALFGLLKPIVPILMFIGEGGLFVGYILFFRQASI